MTGQKEEEEKALRRLQDKCIINQEIGGEWMDGVQEAIRMVKEHHQDINDLKSKMALFKDIPSMINDSVEIAVERSLEKNLGSIKASIDVLTANQAANTESLKPFIKAKDNYDRISSYAAILGYLSIIYIIAISDKSFITKMFVALVAKF